jgi:H+-translocating NAD(P) transhydrogenase subunit alpha
MAQSIGVLRERQDGETRVAVVPELVERYRSLGFDIRVEQGAGEGAFYGDEAFAAAGAAVVSREEALRSDVLALVAPPEPDVVAGLRAGQTVIGFLNPLDQPRVVSALAAQGATAVSMELVPRISRAQKMDALSAMSSIGGYRAVLLAASLLPSFFPLMTTAAGTVRPASVLILGAGVAGLQAIATARRIGARVSAYDIRDAVREEVKSLGASFVELELETQRSDDTGGYARALEAEKARRQTELLIPFIGASDVVISTALIPGRPAPVLITRAAVSAMKPGSVIIDMAASNGGNCELTEAGSTVIERGVSIVGPLNLAAEMPVNASQMYARTVFNMISEFTRDQKFALDFDDDIVKGSCVVRDGEIVNERVRALVSG